jgi:Zn-dependent protease with chaperone function
LFAVTGAEQTAAPPVAPRPARLEGAAMSVRTRVALSVALLAGFFLLLAAVLMALVAGAVYGLATGRAVGAKLAVAAVVVLVAAGGAVHKVRQTRPAPHGAWVGRARQPELWQLVDELAAAAGTRGPDEIRVVPGVNAAVWEGSSLLGLRPGRRYLEVGLPLLAGLSVSELRAVLAHELGHLGHGHTRFAAVTYRASMTLGRTVAGLGGVLGWVFGKYARLYARVSRGANRAQELQADLAAARAAGRDASCNALRKLPALDAAWEHFSDNYIGLARAAGRTPELLSGFNAFLADPTRRGQLAQLAAAALDREPTSPFDSHPPARARIAALERLPEAGQPVDERPAWSVLHDPAAAMAELEAELLVDGLGPRASWEEVVRLAAPAVAAHNAGQLATAAVRAGVAGAGTLSEVLDAVERGDGPRLVQPLVGPSVPAEHRAEASDAILAALLADFVVAALMDAGHAAAELSWSGPWTVRLADGNRFDPESVHPERIPALRGWLISSGVPLSYTPPAPVPEPTPA